jgi:prepilin-type N-terminal cleavage/methylation domain-containing protein
MKATDERGVTLIEVLVAMGIMTVALVALAGIMAITLRMQMLGRNQTSATRLAQAKLDELVGSVQNWNTATEIEVGGSLTANASGHNDSVTGFTRRWVVSAGPVDPGSNAGDLRVVTVRVIPVVTDTRATASVELTTLLRSPF